VIVKHGPWFAIRDFGDGQSLAVIHWKGAAAIVAALVLGGGALLVACVLFGGTRIALSIGAALLAVSLAGLYVAIARRTVDERR
jgi:hypothetical protein